MGKKVYNMSQCLRIGLATFLAISETLQGTIRRQTVLETIAVILIVLWLLGIVSGYTLGNFIYVLLAVAIVIFLARLITGRRL